MSTTPTPTPTPTPPDPDATIEATAAAGVTAETAALKASETQTATETATAATETTEVGTLTTELATDTATVAADTAEIAKLEAAAAPAPPAAPAPAAPNGATLLWSDEFSGTALDTTKWSAGWWYAPTTTSVGGAELCVPGQVAVDGNGHLLITAVREATPNTAYTWLSGLINTSPNGAKPGYAVSPPFFFEIGAQMPTPPAGQTEAPGLWPAGWLLHNGGGYEELDDFEVVKGLSYSTWHPSGTVSTSEQPVPATTNLTAGFHGYGIMVTDTTIDYYFDGAHVGTEQATTEVPGSFFIVLNLAVGNAGSWPGPATTATPSPSVMTVDYVHVWTAVPYAAAG